MNRAAQLLWNGVRFPIVGVLLLLEPVVRWVCSLVVVLGVLTCVVWELSAAGPRFPLAKVLGISLGFAVVYFLYFALISVFLKD